jgi:hypothetical protein
MLVESIVIGILGGIALALLVIALGKLIARK